MSEKENSPKFTKDDVKKIATRNLTIDFNDRSKKVIKDFESLFKEWEKSQGKEENIAPSQEQDSRDDDR